MPHNISMAKHASNHKSDEYATVGTVNIYVRYFFEYLFGKRFSISNFQPRFLKFLAKRVTPELRTSEGYFVDFYRTSKIHIKKSTYISLYGTSTSIGSTVLLKYKLSFFQ